MLRISFVSGSLPCLSLSLSLSLSFSLSLSLSRTLSFAAPPLSPNFFIPTVLYHQKPATMGCSIHAHKMHKDDN